MDKQEYAKLLANELEKIGKNELKGKTSFEVVAHLASQLKEPLDLLVEAIDEKKEEKLREHEKALRYVALARLMYAFAGPALYDPLSAVIAAFAPSPEIATFIVIDGMSSIEGLVRENVSMSTFGQMAAVVSLKKAEYWRKKREEELKKN